MQLDLANVTKRLGGTLVLDAVDLSIVPGQIVVVLGANGAGKTTLLHLLGGLYQPDVGTICVDGEKMNRARIDQRRRLHYLPDIPLLGPAHTPLDYILLALEAYGVNDSASDQRIGDLLDEFDMLAVAETPSRALSRGQRYKATLVALLAIDPELWILDEPFTSGMDPLGLSAMQTHLIDARGRGRAIVYSTQLVEIARRLSDRVCILAESKCVAYCSMAELDDLETTSVHIERLLKQLHEPIRPDTASESNNV